MCRDLAGKPVRSPHLIRSFGYNVGMTVKEIVKSEEFKSVIEDYRSMFFWNMDENFFSPSKREVLLALGNLETYGDMRSYRLAGEIRKSL